MLYRFLTSVISIHALRGEGDTKSNTIEIQSIEISIHALRGEGDADKATTGTRIGFQSTPSVGRATFINIGFIDSINISIHALRGEGDLPKTL